MGQRDGADYRPWVRLQRSGLLSPSKPHTDYDGPGAKPGNAAPARWHSDLCALERCRGTTWASAHLSAPGCKGEQTRSCSGGNSACRLATRASNLQPWTLV